MSESHIVWTLMLDWDVIVEHYGFTNLQAMCDLCLKMTVTLSWDLFEIAVFGYCFGWKGYKYGLQPASTLGVRLYDKSTSCCFVGLSSSSQNPMW